MTILPYSVLIIRGKEILGRIRPPRKPIPQEYISEGVRKTGDGRWIARCPAHQDRGPSLSLRELPDGRLLLHCFAGCPVADVLGAVGLEFGALFPDAPREHHAPRERLPFDPLTVLKAMAHEALVVALIAEDMRKNPLGDEASRRLDLAVQRIREGVSLAEGANHGRR